MDPRTPSTRSHPCDRPLRGRGGGGGGRYTFNKGTVSREEEGEEDEGRKTTYRLEQYDIKGTVACGAAADAMLCSDCGEP
ncbi:hypothetical protein ONZ45_g13233 [Pleurotus djamor]|nr:hypothetical protein ONZ45_g13233 [Pleurotus djamor]